MTVELTVAWVSPQARPAVLLHKLVEFDHRLWSSEAAGVANDLFVRIAACATWMVSRMIYDNVPFGLGAEVTGPSEAEQALQMWKSECALLMIQQKGCISKKLLRCRDANEFISYSEWNFEADIATYTIIFLVVFGLIWLMW
jgi:hypothetical protein